MDPEWCEICRRVAAENILVRPEMAICNGCYDRMKKRGEIFSCEGCGQAFGVAWRVGDRDWCRVCVEEDDDGA